MEEYKFELTLGAWVRDKSIMQLQMACNELEIKCFVDEVAKNLAQSTYVVAAKGTAYAIKCLKLYIKRHIMT